MPFKIVESRYSLKDFQELADKEIRNRLRLTILNANVKVSNSIRDDLNKTTLFWNEDTRVYFKTRQKHGGTSVKLGSGNSKIEHLIYAYKGNTDIWNLLDLGCPTQGRGDKEWKAKTTSGTFESGEGSGWWNPNVNQMNLISARGWTALIDDTYEDKYRDELQDAVFAGIDEINAKLNRGRG